jgi:hypothetical protein
MAWQDWQPGQTLADISARLRGGHSTVLALRGVANARLRDEAKTLVWVAAGGPPTLGRLREARVDAGIDPEDLWDLAEASGYAVRIGCSTQGLPGAMDVVFHRPGADVDGYAVQAAPRPWHRYANNPLLGKLRRALIPKLRAGLQARLPDYMVPSAFVLLDALPLTPNGKLDRAALPAPGASVGAAEFAAPQTPAEQALAAIWAEVLGVERVGRADNFFALGGHSLLATQVASRLRHALHVDLPIRAVFEHATLQALAVELDEALAARSAHTAYLAPEQAAGEDEMELLI